MTAIVYREYTLLCDRAGCGAAYGPFGVERTRAALRRLAARDGWSYDRGRDLDFCPEDGEAASS